MGKDKICFNLSGPDAVETLAGSYADASPFPHIVLTETFPQALCQQIVDENPTDSFTQRWGFPPTDVEAFKLGKDKNLTGAAAALIAYLNRDSFVSWLSELTGIPDLLPDHELVGGGLHAVLPLGYLGIHADFNLLPERNLYRRVNLLLYLNLDWDESWGGDLELWNVDMTRMVRQVPPHAGTMVIFTTSEHSFHGHPDILLSDRARYSIALYYYTTKAPKEFAGNHSTLFQRRP